MAVRDINSRNNAAEVLDVVSSEHSEGMINRAINTAYNLVQDNLLGKGLSANALKDIELYLSAHFVVIIDGQAEEEDIAEGEYRIAYAGEFGEGLKGTRHGQVAISLDTSGTLAKLSLRPAKFLVFNTPPLSSPIDDLP